MRTKVALINVGVAIAMVASFMALSGGSVAARPIHQSKTISLTLAGWPSTPTEPKDLQKVVSAFEKSNKGYKVKLEEYPNNYDTTVEASLLAGKGPDVFYVDSSVFRAWEAAGALQSISGYVKKDKSFDVNDIYAGLRRSFTVKGQLYGLPKDYSTLGLFINTGIWKAAHLGKAPTTWSAFAHDACVIRSYETKHGHKHVYGAGLANDQARWQPLLQSLHGSVLNHAQTKPEIDSKAGVTAIKDWADLVKKGCAAEPSQLGTNWSGGEFETGNAAMVWEGPWLVSPMQTTYKKIHFKIYPLPVHGNLAFTVAYSMNPHASNKAAAWKLMSYLTGKVGEQKWVNLFQVLPARKSLKPPKGDGVFIKGSKYAQGWVFAPGYFNTNGPYTVLNNDLDKVALHGMSPSAAAKDVANAIKAWVATGQH